MKDGDYGGSGMGGGLCGGLCGMGSGGVWCVWGEILDCVKFERESLEVGFQVLGRGLVIRASMVGDWIGLDLAVLVLMFRWEKWAYDEWVMVVGKVERARRGSSYLHHVRKP